jgi:Glycosyltransferase family 87
MNTARLKPEKKSISSRWGLWLCWLALVFGIFNVYGRPIESFRTASDPNSISIDALQRRLSTLDRVLIDLRDDPSVRFYNSIAQATVGGPYQPRYVHPFEEQTKFGVKSGANDHDISTNKGESFVTPNHSLRPWRDFFLEYPPGMLVTILLPAILTKDRSIYFTIFNLEMEAMLTLAVYLSYRTLVLLGSSCAERVITQSIFVTAALGVVAVRRYDPSVALAISTAIFGLAARRPCLSGVALGLGVALKGVPLILAPIFAFWFTARRDWHGFRLGFGGFAFCMAVATAAYLFLAGPHAFEAFTYHMKRPIQIESLYSAIIMLARIVSPQLMSIEYSFGSYNIVSPIVPLLQLISTTIVIMSLLAVYIWAYRRIFATENDRDKLILVIYASCACLVAVISLGKVSNSQYLVWIIPIGALAGTLSAGDARWRLVMACALAQVVYPFLYTAIVGGLLAPFDGILILARDFSLWRWLMKLISDPVAGSGETAGIVCAGRTQARPDGGDDQPSALWKKSDI